MKSKIKLGKMTLSEIKKRHALDDEDIAKITLHKNAHSYKNSTAKKRFDRIIEHFYNLGRESNKE